MPRGVDLLRQRGLVVVQVVLLEERLHLGGDLGVPVGRQVGEEVVLDLVGEVAGHQVRELPAGDVGRAEHLADVPLAAGLVVGDRLLLEGLHALGEVAAHDHRVRPDVAHDVGHEVAGQRADGTAEGQRHERVHDVVLGGLLADLLQRLRQVRLELLAALLLRHPEVLAELEVVGGDAVLEEAGVDEVPHRLGEVEGHPALVLVDAHDAVAEVVVLADDVRVRVVDLVVAVLPAVRGRGVVPLPGGRVDLRVTHPVPLAVHDVVPDLHVLEDLRDREADGAEHPQRRQRGAEQHGARAQLELALHVDDATDVRRVLLAPGVDDVLADRVELDADLLDVGLGEVGGGVLGLAGDGGHQVTFRVTGSRGSGVAALAPRPAAGRVRSGRRSRRRRGRSRRSGSGRRPGRSRPGRRR